MVAETSSNANNQNTIKERKKLTSRKLQELKLAFSEFYLSLILLQNYQNLNFTGFRKILKKHDKVCNYTQGGLINLRTVTTQSPKIYFQLFRIKKKKKGL